MKATVQVSCDMCSRTDAASLAENVVQPPSGWVIATLDREPIPARAGCPDCIGAVLGLLACDARKLIPSASRFLLVVRHG